MVKIAVTVKPFQDEAEARQHAVSALKECLRQIPGAQISVRLEPILPEGIRPDLLAHLTLGHYKATLFGKVSKTGEPRYARAAFYQLERYRQSEPSAVGVLIAPYISPATGKLCREHSIGYLDLAGNCHLAFDGIYIHIEGKPNPAAHSRPLLSLYQPKAERILRVLLTYPSQSWRLQALADEAEVSVGQSFKVKELLLEKEWIQETERGISLTKPRELLAAWADNYRFDKHKAGQFYTLSNIEAFAHTLSIRCRQRGIPCAFTSFAAAAQYAPYATYRRTTAYIHYELAEVQELLRLIQLDSVETGADVILLSPYDDGVFYGVRQQQDISLASPLQTYLDLQNTGGRGQEAAEVLLQKEIAPNW